MALPADEHVEQLRRAANDQVIELVRRAKGSGRLRQDFVGEDLLLLLIANAAVLHVTRADAPEAWRRFVALVVSAFEDRDAQPQETQPQETQPQETQPRLPAPPSTEEMTRAMLRLARERGCGSRGC
jgi:hypothetical protein